MFEQYSGSGHTTLRRAGHLARRSGAVTPAHLLAAALEVSDSLGHVAALDHAAAVTKADKEEGHDDTDPVHYDMLARQAIATAASWARRRGARAGPEDLVVVLLDQHSPAVVSSLARAGLDPELLHRAAFEALGLPVGYGTVPLEPLPPAGAVDQDTLAIEDLPVDAWSELEGRQERLPLRRIRRRSDWSAVAINEQRAVLKMAGRLTLKSDETHSLLHHHLRAVHRLAAEAAPDIVPPPAPPSRRELRVEHLTASRRRRLIPRGWAVWFDNRRVGLKAAWFRRTGQRY
ncbi:MAG TPA: hypothetical protein VGR90_04125 [Acidimicrobiales bacterium]|nr:hypothetical protein [Acidimicrobiales bacterium]